MKRILPTLLLAITIIAALRAADRVIATDKVINQAPAPITATVYNDATEEISVRIRFRNNELYWSDWVHVPQGHASVVIPAKHPEDSIYGFAMMGEQATENAANKEEDDKQIPVGRMYLLSDFHSDSGKQFSQIGQDTRIIIRDNKIEVSANLPDQKMYWNGEFVREY